MCSAEVELSFVVEYAMLGLFSLWLEDQRPCFVRRSEV